MQQIYDVLFLRCDATRQVFQENTDIGLVRVQDERLLIVPDGTGDVVEVVVTLGPVQEELGIVGVELDGLVNDLFGRLVVGLIEVLNAESME